VGLGVLTGNSNTIVGSHAGYDMTSGNQNTAVGQATLFETTSGSENVAIGYQAGRHILNASENVIIGATAGDALNVGEKNVAVGHNALGADNNGSRCVAVGWDALGSQDAAGTTINAYYNTAVGANAGFSISDGYYNTLVGGLAGDGITGGLQNTALGYLALSAAAASGNTAIGNEALSTSTGSNNTAIGLNAAKAATSGNGGIFIGKDAGLTGGPGGNFTSSQNVAVFGDENIGACHIQTDWTVASDQRDKTDFTALDIGLDFVKALSPVTYKWDKRSKYGDKTADDYDLNSITTDGTHKEDWLDIGFKAQEVEALEKAAGYKIADKTNLTTSLSNDGKQYGIKYNKFVPILVKAIQEQNALIEALTARVATLEG